MTWFCVYWRLHGETVGFQEEGKSDLISPISLLYIHVVNLLTLSASQQRQLLFIIKEFSHYVRKCVEAW